MRKENSPNSTYTKQASTEEKTSASNASTKSTGTSGAENPGMKPLKECKICGYKAYNAIQLQKFKKQYGEIRNMCKKCYNDKHYTRRITYKGKRIYLKENPRTNICQICGRTKQENLGFQMALHHELYIKGNPLDYTVEECLYCHGKEKRR